MLRVVSPLCLARSNPGRALSAIARKLVLMMSCLCLPVGAVDDAALRERAVAQFGALEPVSAAEREAPLVRLGRALFWDARLSFNGETACASCHLPDDHGSDRRLRSVTARGTETGLHSMTVFNTQTAPAGLRWFAGRDSGKAQAMGSVTGSMGFARRDDLLEVLEAQGYRASFVESFPGAQTPVSVEHYGEALEAYQRSLRTPGAFDAWLRGEDDAMTERQKAGLGRFMDTGCAGCHGGVLFGGGSLEKFGMAADYWEHTGSDPVHDGLMTKTGDAEDRYVFRVSPLRNVAATPPYFHDASVDSLEKAVSVMARLQLGTSLDEAAVRELVSFLHSLTGDVPWHFSPPDDVPGPMPR